jgi:predicted dehydrogenase
MPAAHRLTRRRFIQAAALGASGPLLGLSRRVGAAAPSERVNLGFIGVGKMGDGHVGSFLGMDDVQVVAVCDVVAERREHAKAKVERRYAEAAKSGAYRGCRAFVDYRELLQRDDVDAVVIATPDHWHALPAVHAAQAKKDVYCEKPLAHVISQGRRIVEAVRENQVIFQTGSQQRSEFGGRFRRAVELIRNGLIGDVHTVRIGVGGPAVPCDLPEEPTPEGTEWDRWLGPAPVRGYHEALCPRGVHNHFPAWRNYREYAGGGLADMGAHHFDIAQWALETDDTGPTQIAPPAEGNSGLVFTYAGGVRMIHGGPSGCTFEGQAGKIYVDRSVLESDPPQIVKSELAGDAQRVYHSDNHRRNWLDCIRSRKEPICPAEVGHRSATICLLGNIGYWLRRPLQWDPASEQFLNDDEAKALLDPPMREPYVF